MDKINTDTKLTEEQYKYRIRLEVAIERTGATHTEDVGLYRYTAEPQEGGLIYAVTADDLVELGRMIEERVPDAYSYWCSSYGHEVEQSYAVTELIRACDTVEQAIDALLATFTPFGSLSEGVNQTALAEAMIEWSITPGNAPEEVRLQRLNRVYKLLWAATTENRSTAEFDDWSVALRTPTSGTVITLEKMAGEYQVRVDFGPQGSERRAEIVRTAAVALGFSFHTYR